MPIEMLYFHQTQPSVAQGPMAEEITRAEMFQTIRDFRAAHPDARLPIDLDNDTFDCPAMYFRADWPLLLGEN